MTIPTDGTTCMCRPKGPDRPHLPGPDSGRHGVLAVLEHHQSYPSSMAGAYTISGADSVGCFSEEHGPALPSPGMARNGTGRVSLLFVKGVEHLQSVDPAKVADVPRDEDAVGLEGRGRNHRVRQRDAAGAPEGNGPVGDRRRQQVLSCALDERSCGLVPFRSVPPPPSQEFDARDDGDGEACRKGAFDGGSGSGGRSPASTWMRIVVSTR